jgi:hypothetical protein
MILELLEIGTIAPITIYLTYERFRIHRDRTSAWDLLVAQLKSRPSDSAHKSFWEEDCDHTPEIDWPRIQNARGLWQMYVNAGVMLKMADYAIRDGAVIDPELLRQLRSDATQIRVCIFYALSERACTHMTEEARANLSRVTALYCDMANRMLGLIKSDGSMLNHSFAGSVAS